MELTTKLEIKTGVFVPVRISLDSSATDEQRAEWESIVRVSVGTGFKAGRDPYCDCQSTPHHPQCASRRGGYPVQQADQDYDAYQWYMAMKAATQPLFTFSGWLHAGKPAALAGRSRGGCVR